MTTTAASPSSLMNKWRISAALIAAACLIVVIATTTGVAAAMISTPAMQVQHETEHPKANDGHDQPVPTGEATYKLPLIVAPTLDERALFSAKTVSVKIFDLEFGKKVSASLRISRVTKINETAVIFHAEDDNRAEVRVMNGVTTARLTSDGPFMPVCSADVTCAAFQVDSANVEKLLADTEVNLKNFSEGRRRLDEACRLDQPVFDPLPGQERTRMQSVAQKKCAPLCQDTCPTASDGICSDGGNQSIHGGNQSINPGKEGRFYCAYGTDCADCGARPNDDLDCLILSGQVTMSEQISELSNLSSSSCDDQALL